MSSYTLFSATGQVSSTLPRPIAVIVNIDPSGQVGGPGSWPHTVAHNRKDNRHVQFLIYLNEIVAKTKKALIISVRRQYLDGATHSGYK
jgi:hypothetical protein